MSRADHADCRDSLLRTWEQACAEVGSSEPTEITVSTAPPLVPNRYTQGIRCPHGVTFWIEPTSDQIARWQQEGVR